MESPPQQVKEFELSSVSIADIVLDPSNPNTMTEAQMEAMQLSMKHYGFLVPVILDRNNKVCDGEHRVLAYKYLGAEKIPAYKVDLDSDTDRKQLRQIMNKLHGQHNKEKDAAEFLEILKNSQNRNLEELSQFIAQPESQLLALVRYYHEEELSKLLSLDNQNMLESQDTKSGTQIPVPQRAQLGDIWNLTRDKSHRLYCGNNVAVLQEHIPDNSVDLTVTSPPYDAARTYKGYTFNFEALADQLYRVTKPGGVVVWIVNDMIESLSETLTSFKQAIYFKEIGFKVYDTMIWNKLGSYHPPAGQRYSQNFEYMFVFSKDQEPAYFNPISDIMNKNAGDFQQIRRKGTDGSTTLMPPYVTADFSRRTNVWTIGTGANSSSDRIAFTHPAVFPEELVEDHIRSWSDPGCTILDPFCGSGTTLVTAYRAARAKSIGIEVSPEYCDVILQRWSNLTKKDGYKEGSTPSSSSNEILNMLNTEKNALLEE